MNRVYKEVKVGGLRGDDDDDILPPTSLSSETLTETPRPGLEDRTGALSWLVTIAPLVLHLLASVLLAVFILGYVDRKRFSPFTDRRRIPITQPDGSTINTQYYILQSDVTTIVSAMIMVVKFFASMWCAATAWRCVFILMEKRGMSLLEISNLLRWHLHFGTRTRRRHTEMKRSEIFIARWISVLLIVAFPYQFSGPIVTGSITWLPAMAYTLSQVPLSVSDSSARSGWGNFSDTLDQAERIYHAASWSILAYGSEEVHGIAKRNLDPLPRSITLKSQVRNIAVPYFKLQSFDWIRDPELELEESQYMMVNQNHSNNPWNEEGTSRQYRFTLIPENWDLPSKNRSFPKSSLERRIGIAAGRLGSYGPGQSASCEQHFADQFAVGGWELPQGVKFYPISIYGRTSCFLFARVNYTAGAAICEMCDIAEGPVAQQRIDKLTPIADPLTSDTLAIMPLVLAQVVNLELSTPYSSSLRSLDPSNRMAAYFNETLMRCYSATWSSLTGRLSLLGSDPLLTSDLFIASRVTEANVKIWRVCLWFILNLMLTISGIILVLIQSRCEHAVSLDPPMTALLIDPGKAVPEGRNPFQIPFILSTDLITSDLKLRGNRGKLEII